MLPQQSHLIKSLQFSDFQIVFQLRQELWVVAGKVTVQPHLRESAGWPVDVHLVKDAQNAQNAQNGDRDGVEHQKSSKIKVGCGKG